MRTFHRLRLLDLLLTSTPDVLSTLLLFALSKPWLAHHKETFLNTGIKTRL
jgi:hypothetical protein